MNDIDNLLARFFTGEATPEEAIAVEDWRTSSGQNRKYFDECQLVFSSAQPDQTGMQGAARKKFDRSLAEYYSRRRRRRVLAVAACILLPLIIGLLLLYPERNVSAGKQYSAQDQPRTIRLYEGSTVDLDSHSRILLDTAFGRTSRRMILEGSASFQIRHDPSLPMTVHIDELEIEDIGTVFRISTTEDSIHVKVEEGEILLRDPSGNAQLLIAGEKISYLRRARRLITHTMPQSSPRVPPIAEPVTPVATGEHNAGRTTSIAPDTALGDLVLECRDCGDNGKLILRSVKDRKRMEKQVSFQLAPPDLYYHYPEKLPPGEYLWVYIGPDRVLDHGKITITEGKETRLKLFEKTAGSP